MTLNIRPAISSHDIEACLAIRRTVFVQEQGVPLDMEIDHHDRSDARHFIADLDGQPAATARILIAGSTAKIGRVALLKSARGKGHGRTLMQHLMKAIEENQSISKIALDAQVHLKNFYASLGFVPQGDIFDDAGIDHIHMVLPPKS